MQSAESQESQLICNYLHSDGYVPTYINGAVGGINCRGEVIIHFFVEHTPLPQTECYKLGIGGTVGGGKDAVESQSLQVIRRITGGIIMSTECAEQIQAWLGSILNAQEVKR